MHAIIETGGKQFRVAPGDVIRVPKLAAEVGAEVALGKVVALFRDGGDLLIGENAGAVRVNATISAQDRADKILVFKFKRKKQYKRTQGHRQDYTEVRIRDIVSELTTVELATWADESPAEAAAEEAAPEETTAV
jgi:large subunit ribosomal protein L21